MRMRALKFFRYAGRPYRPGDELEMSDSHAKTMKHIGRVDVAKQQSKPAQTYKRRDMVSEPLDIPDFRQTK